MDNLLAAWLEFLPGKRKRKDVAEFSLYLMDNILALHQDLVDKTYRHGGYHAFRINDPKPRDIHKTSVRDRLVHHAIYRALYLYFDRKFIFDLYSCRRGKGTHRALDRFRQFARQASQNHTHTAWVLKGDIRKFFASIDHGVLLGVLQKYLDDPDIFWLLREVIGSFHTPGRPGVGLPLGNLTSQLLVNIYLNPFDQFVKRRLKVNFYLRYADDFVIFHMNRQRLEDFLKSIKGFLRSHLCLKLHPQKVSITTVASGIDFLGWVHFPHHRVLRTTTKRRMIKRIRSTTNEHIIKSYFGLIKHGDTYKIRKQFQL